MISKEALQEFMAIWREESGMEISEHEAMRLASELLTMFNHIYRPIKKEWVAEGCAFDATPEKDYTENVHPVRKT